MTKLHDTWTVLPHGPLRELAPGLLTVVGQIPMPLGNFPRRMTVVALPKKRTAIFSPIPLDEESMGQIEALGAPAFLIMIAVSLVTYVLSYILILFISRYREYAADRGAALITGAPEYLMSALQKIASDMTRIPQRDLRQVEGMNAFFIIPTSVKTAGAELFMTHPPLEKRLARLADIAAAMGRPVAA